MFLSLKFGHIVLTLFFVLCSPLFFLSAVFMSIKSDAWKLRRGKIDTSQFKVCFGVLLLVVATYKDRNLYIFY